MGTESVFEVLIRLVHLRGASEVVQLLRNEVNHVLRVQAEQFLQLVRMNNLLGAGIVIGMAWNP